MKNDCRPLSGPADVELDRRPCVPRACAASRPPSALIWCTHLRLRPISLPGSPTCWTCPIDEQTELAHELVRVRRDPGPLDALVHRIQVAGLR